MVALNLLAASLLVAGVGSSLGLPSPMNVAVLPAITSFESGSSLGLVSPVTESHDANEGTDYASGVLLFAGIDYDFSDASYMSISYDSAILTLDSDATRSDLDGVATLFIYSSDYSFDISLILPDFSYWDGADGHYELGVVFLDSDTDIADNYGFYGRFSYLSSLTYDAILPISYAELGADVNPVTAIADGLTAIAPLGGALTDGFDAVFMDAGALTSVGMFAFILMGVGISVGITKKCFNWVTGRHGM